MGKGIKEFKKSIREVKDSVESSDVDSLPSSRQMDAPTDSERAGEPKKLSE